MLRLGIELLDGVDQAEHAVADQVGLLDAVGQTGRNTPGHELDQRRIAHDQLVAQVAIPSPLVLGPQASTSEV